MVGFPKPVTFRSKRWLQAVSALDCVICGKHGPSQSAHVNEDKGMGIKTHDCWTAALCPECHSRIDHGKDMTREERRSALQKAVLLTIAKMAVNNWIRV